MTYWAIDVQENIRELFLPKKKLADAAQRDGINPLTVRQAFEQCPAQDRILQVVAKSGRRIEKESVELTDLLTWGGEPFFTERAKRLIVELGGNDDDFLQCAIESNPGEPCFMHAPRRSYDVIDMTRSTFLMMISSDPPIPHHILTLAFRKSPDDLPPCFRIIVPGVSQVFGELIVNGKFRSAWESKKFTGAKFRKLA